MVTTVKEEVFELNRDVTGMETEVDIALSAGEGVGIIWEYPVPTGHSLVFSQEDTFAAYLETSAPAEAGAASLLDIVIMDSSKQSVRSILNQLRYGNVKDFTDKDKLVHLDVPAGGVIVASEGERVCIRGNIAATLDASDSYFSLTCKRVRHTLYE